MIQLQEKNAPICGRKVMLIAFLVTIAFLVQPVFAAVIIPPGTIDPRTIPQFVNQLVVPPEYVPDDGTSNYYTIQMSVFNQSILPLGTLGCPAAAPCDTQVWGYQGRVKDLGGNIINNFQNSPGATFNVTRDQAITVEWVNNITSSHMFPVDPTLHWADPNMICGDPPTCNSNDLTNFTCEYDTWTQMCMAKCTAAGCLVLFPPGYPLAQSPVPLVTHLHGGEVYSAYDGHPEAWWTNGLAKNGPAYSTNIYTYPNKQPPTTLWYHDHALGITRLNVMSGLAGFYLLRDPNDPNNGKLPNGTYEVPLVFQDRTFKTPVGGKAELYFDTAGLNPTIHPYWMPEFFGNTIMVNGKVWPNMNVEQTWYRFRLIDGSNARFYTISFWDRVNGVRLPFYQIGTDGGYLKQPVLLNQLTIAPGERADILVNFSGVAPGTKIILDNSAKYPFPGGTPPDKKTDGTIMQFTVTGPAATPQNVNIAGLANMNPALTTFPSLLTQNKNRTLVLWEVMGPLGPAEILLNGQKWGAPISESPALNSTEEWIIVNPTADTHPIHLHLVQFQLVSRQKIDINKYTAQWLLVNSANSSMGDGMPPWNNTTVEVPIGQYLRGKPQAVPLNEQGWKDTIQVNPGEVTIIRARWAPIENPSNTVTTPYPFDATAGPGYVWHCHILDHEDNEMMRPYNVTAAA